MIWSESLGVSVDPVRSQWIRWCPRRYALDETGQLPPRPAPTHTALQSDGMSETSETAEGKPPENPEVHHVVGLRPVEPGADIDGRRESVEAQVDHFIMDGHEARGFAAGPVTDDHLSLVAAGLPDGQSERHRAVRIDRDLCR